MISALDQAAPLAEWDLPAEFQTLRRLMKRGCSRPFAPARLELCERAFLVRAHQPRVAGDIGSNDRGHLAFGLLRGGRV